MAGRAAKKRIFANCAPDNNRSAPEKTNCAVNNNTGCALYGGFFQKCAVDNNSRQNSTVWKLCAR
jgi:D-arabinose 1-dehydrogenase-like Zn-dependent alcohol dehydrogenase